MTERDHQGRFAPGNRAAAGRTARKVESWRRAFDGAVKTTDIREIVQQLVAAARRGESWAVKLVLERCLGPAEAHDVSARLDEMEARQDERQQP